MEGSEKWRLFDECFVYGLMDGKSTAIYAQMTEIRWMAFWSNLSDRSLSLN